MAFEPAIAVFDACVLYPFHLRNIIIQAATDHLVAGRWTDEIHDEWVRSLARERAVPLAQLQRLRQLMNGTFPTAMVARYKEHVAAVNLPDPNDRHVVAAGIAASATVILTWNQRHFPAKELQRFGLSKRDAGCLSVRSLRQSSRFDDQLSRKCAAESDEDARSRFRLHRHSRPAKARPACNAGAGHLHEL
jgi:predicted nucleic acid-binding protein